MEFYYIHTRLLYDIMNLNKNMASAIILIQTEILVILQDFIPTLADNCALSRDLSVIKYWRINIKMNNHQSH